jgi:hypothetical protein
MALSIAIGTGAVLLSIFRLVKCCVLLSRNRCDHQALQVPVALDPPDLAGDGLPLGAGDARVNQPVHLGIDCPIARGSRRPGRQPTQHGLARRQFDNRRRLRFRAAFLLSLGLYSW